MPDVSGASDARGMPRASTASALAGCALASPFGGLISILVSRLELSSASRLRSAAFAAAALSGGSCAQQTVVSSANNTIRDRIRIVSIVVAGWLGENFGVTQFRKATSKRRNAEWSELSALGSQRCLLLSIRYLSVLESPLKWSFRINHLGEDFPQVFET